MLNSLNYHDFIFLYKNIEEDKVLIFDNNHIVFNAIKFIAEENIKFEGYFQLLTVPYLWMRFRVFNTSELKIWGKFIIDKFYSNIFVIEKIEERIWPNSIFLKMLR